MSTNIFTHLYYIWVLKYFRGWKTFRGDCSRLHPLPTRVHIPSLWSGIVWSTWRSFVVENYLLYFTTIQDWALSISKFVSTRMRTHTHTPKSLPEGYTWIPFVVGLWHCLLWVCCNFTVPPSSMLIRGKLTPINCRTLSLLARTEGGFRKCQISRIQAVKSQAFPNLEGYPPWN